MQRLDNVQRVMSLDAMLVYLEEKHLRAMEAQNTHEVGRIGAELSFYRKERDTICQTWTIMEERRYEVECEERHS